VDLLRGGQWLRSRTAGSPAVTQTVTSAVGAKGSAEGEAVVRRGGDGAIAAPRPGTVGQEESMAVAREDRSAICGGIAQDVMACLHQRWGHGDLRLEGGQ
jgi:hypothetical protein